MAKAEYRSSIRSKTLIKKALAKLLQEKELDRITVSDIIREADISRGTFYAHYSDIFSVVSQIEEEELRSLVSFVDEVGLDGAGVEPERFVTQVCEYLAADAEYYNMLTHSKLLDDFISRLFHIYYEPLLEMVVAQEKCKDANEANLYLLYVTSGAKNILVAWLNQKLTGTPQEIGQMVGRLVRVTMLYYSDQI